MIKKLGCIMLIDDNKDDNFFHERVIKKSHTTDKIVTRTSGAAALEYLQLADAPEYVRPDLVFLDINMPGMNGWEFLEQYYKLKEDQKGEVIIVMLTTSENPDDVNKSRSINLVSEFMTKPLTEKSLLQVLTTHFPNHF
jgi:CheY-like chemotaxis protein